ncbi:hypothetical protein ACJMK2_033335 [Sinanodonta woodiana]|uniref:DBB domain-containing protein n=1 Tax=Sinanodonta woodiana TaxID=1069815 RepID=A0ABD3WNJ0_SINWO
MSTQKEICIHYYPQDGVQWARYLQAKLGEREYEIDIALNDVTSSSTAQGSSRMNVFLITPDFLDLKDLKIMTVFNHQFSLVILMGVDIQNFHSKTKHHGVQEDVNNWFTLEVDGSVESVRHMLMTIVSMYEYDYPPCRVQPIFMEIIEREVNVYIGLEKKAESDVSVQFNGMDEELKATYTDQYFYSFSLKDEEAEMCSTFSVVCKNKKIGKGQLKDIVPSPYEVSSHDDCLTVGFSSRAVGKTQSKLQQLWEVLKDETDPIGLLCQSIGLCGSDSEQLDRKLVKNISVLSFPEHLSLMDIDEGSSQIQREERWPTILHFAAEFNLMAVAESLLRYPAFAWASKIKNCGGRTPDELAHQSGHQELSEMLKCFKHCIDVPVVRRRSHDSGFGDKVRLSQIKSYVDEMGSPVCSQISPLLEPHIGRTVLEKRNVRPPRPRPIQMMHDASWNEKAERLDCGSDPDLTTGEVKREENDSNVHTLQDSSIHKHQDGQEKYIELQTDLLATEEILFSAHPSSKNEFPQSKLAEEPKSAEISIPQQFDIRLMHETVQHEAKTRGFLFKLFKRKEKPRHYKRSLSDGIMESVFEFRRQNGVVRRHSKQYEGPVERESDIIRSKSASSHSGTRRHEHDNAVTHAKRDKNISGPSDHQKSLDIVSGDMQQH